MKYSPEKKAEALARIAEVGVGATSQEMSITAQTLYKWQRELKEGGGEAQAPMIPPEPEINDEEIRQIILNDKALQATVERLEATVAGLEKENAALRRSNDQMKRMLIASLPQG